jgi:hypothetical protein
MKKNTTATNEPELLINDAQPFSEWKIKNEMTVTEYGGINPQNVEIDFENKTITVN